MENNGKGGNDDYQQLDAMERKRQEYIKELIVTEEAYIVDMQLVHEVIVTCIVFGGNFGVRWPADWFDPPRKWPMLR